MREKPNATREKFHSEAIPDLETVTAIVEQELSNMAKKFVKQYGIQAAPVYTLREALELYSLAKLRRMAKSFGMPGCTKKSKPELAAAIADEVLQAERLEEILYIEDEEVFEIFLDLMKVNDKEVPFSSILNLEFLTLAGYVQCFLSGGTIYTVVPEEIKALYSELVQAGYPERRKRARLLNGYAMAAVSLYGAIKQQDLVDIFNMQNEDKTDIDEMFSCLIRFVAVSHGYCFYDEYIVDDSFAENDFEDFFEFVDVAASKPRYLPEKEEFLRYADYDYYEQTPQTLALKNYIGKVFPMCRKDPLLADDLVDEIVYLGRDGGDLLGLMDLLKSYDLRLKNEKQMKQFFSLVFDVQNNVRLWINNGHTLQELLPYEKAGLNSLSPGMGKTGKPGRNDPCPCGSGKKYKKCCGSN